METKMSAQIPVERFKSTLLECLDETFSTVHGIYLDKGTTLFETLAGVSAAEAYHLGGIRQALEAIRATA